MWIKLNFFSYHAVSQLYEALRRGMSLITFRKQPEDDRRLRSGCKWYCLIQYCCPGEFRNLDPLIKTLWLDSNQHIQENLMQVLSLHRIIVLRSTYEPHSVRFVTVNQSVSVRCSASELPGNMQGWLVGSALWSLCASPTIGRSHQARLNYRVWINPAKTFRWWNHQTVLSTD